jgi:diaminopimelate decarboxylase
MSQQDSGAFWHYRDGVLHGGDHNLLTVAKQFGTPAYIYSQTLIEQQWQAYQQALNNYPHLLCYAVKANGNLAILQLLARLGAGFDIVSGGELERVLRAGGQPDKIVFSGVGKSVAEIQRALEVDIHCFNVESVPELDRIQQIAQQLHKVAQISLRVNPNIDAKTHPYISTGMNEHKFGISMHNALEAYRYAKKLPNIKIIGVDCHIGSQITQLSPFIEALESVLALIKTLKNEQIPIQHINLGGGLGVHYHNETPPTPAELCQALIARLPDQTLTLSLEPGRSIVANAGVLLTQVDYIKSNEKKNFAIVDAGMTDLIRPALYNAWQPILPVQINEHTAEHLYDVVGPVCESADFLGKDRALRVQANDYLAVTGSGAYGFVMSSQYNARPRAAEVLLTPNGAKLIRERETYADLWAREILQ